MSDYVMTGATPDAINAKLASAGLVTEDGPVAGLAVTPVMPVITDPGDPETGEGMVIAGHIIGLRFTGADMPSTIGLRPRAKGEPGFAGEAASVAEPAPLSIGAIRSAAKAKVVAWADAFGARFTAGYPQSEIASWGEKLRQARTYADDPNADVPLIRAEAQGLGVTPAYLADRVILKGAVYEQAAAMIAVVRQKTIAGIDAAQTAEQVEAVLATALSEAEAAYRALVGA
jgi:hypothetical protein